MTFKHFYKAIIIRLLIIVLLTVIASYSIFVHQAYFLSCIFLILLIAGIINILKYINQINKWISFFLLGIENEDTMLKIPQKTGNKVIDDIFIGMEKLNSIFKQTKIQINTQEQYFSSVISQSATGLFSVNEKGRVININTAATKFTNLNNFHHVNSLQIIDKALPDFIMSFSGKDNQKSAIFENVYGQKLLFKLSEIITENETLKLVAVSDITKELDNREVDAWVKLSRTLSHEILNNITPITTLSQVISGYFIKNNKTIDAIDIDPKTIANTVKGLKVIEEQSVGLMNFVDNYRQFTKIPQPKKSQVNMSSLIENILIAASAFADFNTIQIKKNIPKNILFNTDEKLLSQVVINVLKNASEALTQSNTQNPTIDIKLSHIGDSIKIAISNNGPCISAETRENIFVPFYTTKEEGSGIGLSLSKQLILQMNGDIFLASKIDDKTTFVIVLNY